MPNSISLGNAFFGLLSIVMIFNNQLKFAVLFMIISAILDYFDGRIARKRNKEGEFGKNLDSLADTVSFGVAPSILMLKVVGTNILTVILISLFLFAGVLRLARYNILYVKDFYIGIPITLNGIMFPFLYIFRFPNFSYYVLCILSTILMVSEFKIKKR